MIVVDAVTLALSTTLSGFLSALLVGAVAVALPLELATTGAFALPFAPVTSPRASRLRLVAAAESLPSLPSMTGADLEGGAEAFAREAAVAAVTRLLLPAVLTSFDAGLARRTAVRVDRAAVVAFSFDKATVRVVRVVRLVCRSIKQYTISTPSNPKQDKQSQKT
jgi:hypothetical protein